MEENQAKKQTYASNTKASSRQGVESCVPNYVDLAAAQHSDVVRFAGLLTDVDLAAVLKCRQGILEKCDPIEQNPQNKTHHNKSCLFLHGPGTCGNGLQECAPRVLAKLLKAAIQAKEIGKWADPTPFGAGPLNGINMHTLTIRVVELWEYHAGGGLVDDNHIDAGSIVTIVCLVNEATEFSGGTFRTFEIDETHKEHLLARGDVVCFVSHKKHNVVPVEVGHRTSLVIELWQGGVPGFLR